MKYSNLSKEELIAKIEKLELEVREFKRVRENLKEIDEKFSKVFYDLPIPLQMVNIKTGERIDENESLLKLLEITKEEFKKGTSFSDIYWVNPEMQKKGVEHLTKNKIYRNHPTDIKLKSGEIRNLLSSGVLLDIEDGNTAILSFIDITELKRAEERIKESYEKYKDLANSITDLFFALDEDLKYTFWNVACEKLLGVNAKDAIGMSFYDLEINKGFEWIAEKYKEVFKNQKSDNFEADFRSDEATIYFQINVYPTRNGVVVYSKDITKRKLAEQVLGYREESLKRILVSISGKKGDEYFQEMVKALNEVTKAKYSFIGELVDNNSIKTIAFIHKGEISKNFIYKLDHTPCENVIDKDTCIYPEKISELFPKDQLLIDMNIEAYIGTPIYNRKKVCVGIIVSLYEQPLKQTSFVKSIFEIFSVNIAGELERIKTENDLKEYERELEITNTELTCLAQHMQNIREKERKALAREMHDDLGQTLTALKLDLIGAKNQLGPEKKKQFENIASMIELSNQAIKTTQQITSELRPGIIDDLGLIPAIECHIDQFIERSKIKVNLVIKVGEEEIKTEHKIVIYRILQEVLTNILRHSGASRITIMLENVGEDIVLFVKDNGRGITNEEKERLNAFGLIGMRERAHAIKGKIKISGTKNKGTTVKLYIPIKNR